MIKSFKLLVAGLALAASSITANAASVVVDLGTISGSYINTFTKTAGETFIDHINFSITGPANIDSAANHLDLSFTIPGLGNVALYNITDMFYDITGPSGFSTGPFSANNTTTTTLLNVAGDYHVNLFGKATGTQGGIYAVALNVTAVPEPETYALMLAGLGLVGFAARRRKSAV